MTANLRSTLPARLRHGNPMAAFDRLPPGLRRWLAAAALPWSAQSALRLWRRALAETGCETAARRRLDAAEARLLAREAEAVWGHPRSGAGRRSISASGIAASVTHIISQKSST